MLQFNLMVLIFTIITIIKLQKSLESVLLDVFLPVLILVPAIYALRIPHVPPVSTYDAVLIPLGVATLVRRSHYWRFQRADLWVFGFAFSGFITDCIRLDIKTALYDIVDPSGFLGGTVAYIVGKLLIEQTANRERFARRLTSLLAIVGAVSVSEFILKQDFFVKFTHVFFGRVDYWGDQIRYGFLRVKGPFMGPEEAGIVFLMGFFFSLWICFLCQTRTDQLEPKYWGFRRSTLSVGAIVLGLAMTLSRGPQLGAASGYLIARAGWVKNKRLALLLALVVISSGFVIARQRAEALQAVADEASSDESKASATYRTRLYEVYKPMAEAGGTFGWSATAYKKATVAYPNIANFGSIDNEYLLLWVTQGKAGLVLFLLISIEGVIALIRALRHSQHPVDTCFYYCLGGILVGVLIVLSTVFLAGQGYILFFLIGGWIQSASERKKWVPATPRLVLRRVFT